MIPPLSPEAERWVILHHVSSTDSTQRLAKEAAEKGADEGHVFLADEQTQGRGRLDRAWDSGMGGLWFSLILRPTQKSDLSGLSLIVALTLQEVLLRFGVSSRVKWPNDVVISTDAGLRKLAGILTESSIDSQGPRWVVVGVGLNCTNQLPPELQHLATRVADWVSDAPSPVHILDSFLVEFRRHYDSFQVNGFSSAKDAYTNRMVSLDEMIALQTASGVVSGIVLGVNHKGQIQLQNPEKIVELSEGEILPLYNQPKS